MPQTSLQTEEAFMVKEYKHTRFLGFPGSAGFRSRGHTYKTSLCVCVCVCVWGRRGGCIYFKIWDGGRGVPLVSKTIKIDKNCVVNR